MEVTKIRARQQGLCEGEIVVEEMSTPRCQEMGQFLLATIYIYSPPLFRIRYSLAYPVLFIAGYRTLSLIRPRLKSNNSNTDTYESGYGCRLMETSTIVI
jgi:hypothetical protein